MPDDKKKKKNPGNKKKKPAKPNKNKNVCRRGKICKVRLFVVDPGKIKHTKKKTGCLYVLKWRVMFVNILGKCIAISIPVVEHVKKAGVGIDIRKWTNFFAQFSAVVPSYPQCCEFRQYVRGGFYLWGIQIPTPMNNGLTLQPNVWQEDGMNGFRYGHRTDKNRPPIDVYSPTREKGDKYEGKDAPGISCIQPGTPYKVELYFVDYIEDTCRGIVELKNIRFWDMVEQGTA